MMARPSAPTTGAVRDPRGIRLGARTVEELARRLADRYARDRVRLRSAYWLAGALVAAGHVRRHRAPDRAEQAMIGRTAVLPVLLASAV